MRLKLWPLLSGEVAIDSFVLDKASLNLETDRQGRGNWQFDKAPAPQARAQNPAPAQAGGRGNPLSELRLGAMLDGVRGQPAADRHSIARMLSGLSAWASAMQTVLRELDLNPVILNEDGPLAVDCVMVFDRLP